MILKGNQRAGGQQLAAHLMNSFDNERVEVAEVRGAVAQDLSGAFAEWNAHARGTKAIESLYSFSASPDPAQRPLSREEYLELLARTERSLNLVGQPRAVVFHVKDGREHIHAVWSRIDTDKMKAIQLSDDRLKLRTVAREFARDHGLELPDGLKKDGKRDRFDDRAKQENLGERQQKERTGISKEQRLADIATCWRETGNGAAFVQALETKGYFLAHGDQRAFVVVDLHGEIHSLSRQLSGVAKSKELKVRLAGYPLDKLPDVEAAQAWAKKQREEAMRAREREGQEKTASEVQQHRDALQQRQAARRAELDQRRIDLLARHLTERGGLKAVQEAENTGIVSARLQKQPKGLMAFLTRITGIKMIVERRQQQQDQLRAGQHKQQAEALQRRHDRELQEIERRSRALDRLEARENRSAETALQREEFQKIAELIRKPPGRELKPEFDRAARQVNERTGTDDARSPEKGRLSGLFKRGVEALHSEPPEPTPAPVPVRQDFEKAGRPPIDLTEEFNREVENRTRQEDIDREPDSGPDRSFDPTDPKN